MRACIGGLVAFLVAACGPPVRGGDDDGADANCALSCSSDLHSIIDCNGNTTMECAGASACDPLTFTCTDACVSAELNKRSIGCDYYATDMELQSSSNDYCFAAFVANTWTTPAKITVRHNGVPLNAASFTRIPTGAGPALTYAPYDPNVGVPPGEVAILFLSGASGGPAPNCPVVPAVPTSGRNGTYVGSSFNIQTDVPVVAYQINPYGGGAVAVTAASLLLPTSAWDVNYVAVNVSAAAAGRPSMNIVAKSDGTIVTMTPIAAVVAGTGIPAGTAGQPLNITLNAGQHAQISQTAELTGSAITATAPIGFMAGHECMNIPVGTSFCDHGEQMVPPVKALGSRYVGVMYRPRVPAETTTFWRIIGAVDGTTLSYNTPIAGAPTTINKGQVALFETGTPFVVTSQDTDHPFMLFTYMSGSTRFRSGFGDPDFVVSVPPEQYLSSYVFFADPTYPETNLVFIRTRGTNGQFHDVTLDCLGTIPTWTPIDNDFQWARVDLVTGNFMGVGSCSTGRREASSTAPFGLWVWGWGTETTTTPTRNVSYGYPGGMNVQQINDVIF
ncbi:MAG: IgGFc-binding protein [Kofleriaceae bacterium]